MPDDVLIRQLQGLAVGLLMTYTVTASGSLAADATYTETVTHGRAFPDPTAVRALGFSTDSRVQWSASVAAGTVDITMRNVSAGSTATPPAVAFVLV